MAYVCCPSVTTLCVRCMCTFTLLFVIFRHRQRLAFDNVSICLESKRPVKWTEYHFLFINVNTILCMSLYTDFPFFCFPFFFFSLFYFLVCHLLCFYLRDACLIHCTKNCITCMERERSESVIAHFCAISFCASSHPVLSYITGNVSL